MVFSGKLPEWYFIHLLLEKNEQWLAMMIKSTVSGTMQNFTRLADGMNTLKPKITASDCTVWQASTFSAN